MCEAPYVWINLTPQWGRFTYRNCLAGMGKRGYKISHSQTACGSCLGRKTKPSEYGMPGLGTSCNVCIYSGYCSSDLCPETIRVGDAEAGGPVFDGHINPVWSEAVLAYSKGMSIWPALNWAQCTRIRDKNTGCAKGCRVMIV